jgi:hypothetical protein
MDSMVPVPARPARDDAAPIPLDAAQVRVLRRRRRKHAARCRNCGAPTAGTGTGLGRCGACYRYSRRHGQDHLAKRIPAVLAAWQAGRLSEGQAARVLGVDRLGLRGLRDEAFAQADAIWAAVRQRPREAAGEATAAGG